MSIVIEPHGRLRWRIRATYFSRKLQYIGKNTPGLRWSSKTSSWVGFADAVDACAERLRVELKLRVEGDVPEPDPDPVLTYPLATKELFDYQITGAEFLVGFAREGAILADAMGLGKEQPVSEPVLTPTGWGPIGFLRVGSEVIGSDGRPTKVMGVFPQGRKKVYRVTFTDGSVVRCGIEHLWQLQTAQDRYKGNVGQTISLREIRKAGLRDKHGNSKWFVPTVAPVQFQPRTFGVSPYAIGALVANGHIAASVRLHCQKDQAQAVVEVLPAGYELRSASSGGYTLCRSGARGGSNPLAQTIRRMNLCDYEPSVVGVKKSHTKRIPSEYLLGSVEQRVSLLQGLCDNDGTVTRDGMTVEYNTTSPELACQVVELVRSLGGIARRSSRTPTYTYKGEKKQGRTDHRIRMSLPEGIVPFRIKRKRSRFIPRTKYRPVRAIESIEPAGREESVCIRVAAEDHLYVTNCYVLTHNTATALRAARALGGRTLVICPAMVRKTWADEAARWWPAAKVGTLDGVKKASEDAFREATQGVDLLVVHYDIVHAWAEFLRGWARLGILDEAHYLISDKARRSRAIKRLFEEIPHRFALTGTPMMSRPRDMWNLLDTLYPGRFGRFFSFALRYSEAHQEQVESKKGSALSTKVFWKFDGASNLPELKRRLEFVMLRRTKKQVASQLPPLRRQVLDLVVPKNKIIAPVIAFKSETALRRALTLAADGKLPEVIQLVTDHARGMDHKVIVWCWRRAVAEAIANAVHKELGPAGVKVAVAHGGQTHVERRKRIERHPDVLCATMDSIGVGINLIEFDTQVFAELSWLPSTLSQCEARPHRHGQTRPVLSQFCIARGTCDEWILEGVIKKLDLGDQLGLDPSDQMLEDLESSNIEKRQEGLRDLYERVRDRMEGTAA